MGQQEKRSREDERDRRWLEYRIQEIEKMREWAKKANEWYTKHSVREDRIEEKERITLYTKLDEGGRRNAKLMAKLLKKLENISREKADTEDEEDSEKEKGAKKEEWGRKEEEKLDNHEAGKTTETNRTYPGRHRTELEVGKAGAKRRGEKKATKGKK